MDIGKIRAIPIAGYLDSIGEKPSKRRGSCLFYRAFWRGGDNPESVKVETEKNLWYDYVAGEGGTIIDLVARIENITTTEAIRKLNGGIQDFKKYVCPLSSMKDTETGIVVIEVKDLFYFPIKAYAKERGISEGVASKYCKEIHYKYGKDGKECFGLAFPTISGGYIIRNRAVKNCTAQDISIISVPGSVCYMVFEGFFDFLSYVEMYGRPKVNAIVLNSVANIKKCYPYFDKADKVYLLLDNDTAGDNATRKLIEKYGDKICDKRAYYKPYKDFNEFLMKGGRNGKI